MASIIGPKYLEKVRSSDYKNSIYAIAELIDNSVDADAKNVEIITVTNQRNIDDIYFIDDGKGMDENTLDKCVIFSETTNSPGTKKTGSFGMGLPNSSMAICKEFSVITEIGGEWMMNTVDIDKMIAEGTLETSPITKLNQTKINAILKYSKIVNPKTIVKWTKIDKLDFVKAETLKERSSRLLGRILRHKISDGLKLRIANYSDGNTNPSFDHIILENDPLYLTKNNSWIAKLVEIESLKGDNDPSFEEFNTNQYFKKFIVEKYKTLPLFYCLEDACQQIEIKWFGKTYVVNIKVAIAYKDIQKPGTRAGGRTLVGKELSYKVRGANSYPSGNISWVRNDREITSGNYSLFNVTQENMRFWSIEVEYETTEDNVIDKLLGLSNSKQSLKFSTTDEMPDDTSETASENNKRIELWARITGALNQGINKASNKLTQQAREFQQFEQQIRGTGGGGGLPGPTPKTYKILLEALGKGADLNSEEIDTLTKKIKAYLPLLKKEVIRDGVESYSKIGLKSIVIYCELDERDFFKFDNYQGKNITMINIKHRFYKQVILPLKDKNEDDILASIELLICSMTNTVKSYDKNKLEIIERFFEDNSRKLREFLEDNEEE